MTITKKKMTVYVVVMALIGAAIVAALAITYNPLKVSHDEITVEFGTPISKEAETYLAEGMDKNIIDKTTVKVTSGDKESTDQKQEYENVGEYTVTLNYKNKSREVKVSVVDTTAPVFCKTADAGIDTIEGVELNFKELITATDLAGVDVKIDDSKINLKKAGEYILKAAATDKNGNKTEKDVKVKVTAAPAAMTGSDVTVDKKTGKVNVTAKTTPKANSKNGYSEVEVEAHWGGLIGDGSAQMAGGKVDSGFEQRAKEKWENGQDPNAHYWTYGDSFTIPEGWDSENWY